MSTQQSPIWIRLPQCAETPVVAAYRLHVHIEQDSVARVRVSADERYELWLDGHRIGHGPERGVPDMWFYDMYDLPLRAGRHVLTARVWRLKELAPLAQMSVAPGFVLWADAPFHHLLSTGIAQWEVKLLTGYSFFLPGATSYSPWFSGANQVIDGASFDWEALNGDGDGWEPAVHRMEGGALLFGIQPEHTLTPGLLPAQCSIPRTAGIVRWVSAGTWENPEIVAVLPGNRMDEERDHWQALAAGQAPFILPPHERRQVIFDLTDYVCAYPQIVVSGGSGSVLTIGWAEALFWDLKGQRKERRDQIEDRYFVSLMRDVFRSDGGAERAFTTLWWRAGRYLHLLVETADEPLTIESFTLMETRYPLEMESRLTLDDERLSRALPLMVRALQMCAHETYLDCPYYEQMMYVGDARLEALTTYAISRDDRLARKALMLFDHSRQASGMVLARFPCCDRQIIPPFALWWVAMIHDYAMWRGDQAFIAGLLPGMRAVLDGFLRLIDSDGLLPSPSGWNFVDWVPAWRHGVPPDGDRGVSGVLNWHLAYTLRLAAELEQWAGEADLAQRYERHRRRLAARLMACFWNDARGLFADDLEHTSFSEHTQALAVLSGALDPQQQQRIAERLRNDRHLTRTTIFFTHCLFEAYYVLGMADAFFERLDVWLSLPDEGFKTTPEQPEPTRSDCHGWGAHPLYHCFATILGIRPASFGFDRVVIAPMPGRLRAVSGALAHPRGIIDVAIEQMSGRLRVEINLPDGLTGIFRYGGVVRELKPGRCTLDIDHSA
ncbi:MAG: alpha-L-rhamnosidase [Roseiflexus castenholzii]|uniref:alpha-L-rhamnosidase-related protein n=1 Tax=Roseiflexus castenholzii TaxID=120962 RepID=UPI000CBCECB9|nr:MAG: alpha-L-rhamnosidase [Roseiflexus castenholzii]